MSHFKNNSVLMNICQGEKQDILSQNRKHVHIVPSAEGKVKQDAMLSNIPLHSWCVKFACCDVLVLVYLVSHEVCNEAKMSGVNPNAICSKH